jgi:site-specific recombinase XerD
MSDVPILAARIDEYLNERGIADSSKRIYRRILAVFIDDVAPGTDGWKARAAKWLGTKKLMPKTKSLHASTVRTFLDWCIKQNFIADNPMDDIRIRNPQARVKRAFTKAEVRGIFASIEQGGDDPERAARDLAAITLMLHTGLRVGGACALKIEDFSDLADGRKVAKYLNKGHAGKDSTAVVSKSVVEALAKYLTATGRDWSSTGPLFAGPHGPLTTAGLAWSIERRFEKAGYPDACAHMLRHTAATTAYLAGADLLAIRDMLGHKNIATTQEYLRSIDRTQRPAEDKINYGEADE